jgi:hypothetical protein
MGSDAFTLLLNALTAIGTVGAVVVALWIAYRQRADALQAQYDSVRPMIVPEQPLMERFRAASDGRPMDLLKHGNFDFSLTASNLRIKNIGPGVATDVCGIVVGPEPSELEPVPPERHSLDIAAPIPAGESLDPITQRNPFLVRGTIQVVPGISLYAPRELTAEEIERGANRIEYRLTLTYRDVFGRTHAAVYDYSAAKRWRTVRIERSVPKGLDVLDQEARAEAKMKLTVSSHGNIE